MIGTVPGWTRPAWRDLPPAELRAYLLELDDHVTHHLDTRPPAGKAAAGDLSDRQPQDPVYWRNFPVVGQGEEASRSDHIAVFDLGRVADRERSDERVHVFPGGFVLEMTWTGTAPDDIPVRARAGMLHFLDADLNLVRVHEYLDSPEVAPLLVDGVPGVQPKQPVPVDARGHFHGWTEPPWRDFEPGELVEHFTRIEAFVDDYVHDRPPPGGIDAEAERQAGIDYRVWRNYRPLGQDEEVGRQAHLEAFDLLRFDDRRRADERTYIFPGGFAYEMTWLGRHAGGEVRTRSLLVYHLDDDLQIVRLHEYVDSQEVAPLLRHGVTP